jgi:FkbM family methyltransferase
MKQPANQALVRLARFLRKSPTERRVTVRYFARRGLSKLPYVPLRVRIPMPPDKPLFFWWSYVASEFRPERTLSEYWCGDVGELRFLWRFLRPGQVFLDLGAHHGVYSILAAKKLGNTGRVVAFEPSVRERRRLNLHLKLNRITTVSVEPYAVGSHNGKDRLFVVVSGFNSMNSLQLPHLDGTVAEVSIETRRLDDYITEKKMARLDLVKIDIEGGELQALRGAQDTLRRFRPLVVCEVLDWVTAPWGYPARAIVSHLAEIGYDWFQFREDGSLETHRPRQGYPEVKNYLAVPREKLEAVREWVRP